MEFVRHLSGFPENVHVDQNYTIHLAMILPNKQLFHRKFSNKTFCYEEIDVDNPPAFTPHFKPSEELNDKGLIFASLLEEFAKIENFKAFRRSLG